MHQLNVDELQLQSNASTIELQRTFQSGTIIVILDKIYGKWFKNTKNYELMREKTCMQCTL